VWVRAAMVGAASETGIVSKDYRIVKNRNKTS
jgi:hypothetical protein